MQYNSNNHNNDSELIARFQRGEIRAFDLLMNKYYRTIYQAFIYKGIPKEDACDFTQILCTRLFRILQNFELQISFKAYLQQSIQNMFLDYLKSKLSQKSDRTSLYLKIHNQKKSSQKILLDVLENLMTPQPEQDVHEKELIEIIRSCIDAMKHPVRRILVCLWLDGYKRKTMSELLGIPMGTVHSTLDAGQKMLRKCVENKYKY